MVYTRIIASATIDARERDHPLRYNACSVAPALTAGRQSRKQLSIASWSATGQRSVGQFFLSRTAGKWTLCN